MGPRDGVAGLLLIKTIWARIGYTDQSCDDSVDALGHAHTDASQLTEAERKRALLSLVTLSFDFRRHLLSKISRWEGGIRYACSGRTLASELFN